MYNQKQKSNVHLRKKHKIADRKGGVNPYGQPDRKISVFFFDDFPKPKVENGDPIGNPQIEKSPHEDPGPHPNGDPCGSSAMVKRCLLTSGQDNQRWTWL